MRLAFYLFLLLPLAGLSQTLLTGDLETRMSSVIGNLPGEDLDDYARPTYAQMQRWDTLITYIIDENYSAAASLADTFRYELYLFTDTATTPDVDYYLLEKDTTGLNYWGTYIFNHNAARPSLVLMSPHLCANAALGYAHHLHY